MKLTKSHNSWVRCWNNKICSVNWSFNWAYSGNWGLDRSCFFDHSKHNKFNNRYRSMHWGRGI